MSCFLAILRCIIGVDDNQEEETRLRNSNRYNSPYYDTPSRGYVPPTTTTSTNATTYGQIREPSGAYRTTPSGAYGTTPSGAYRTTSSGAYGTTPSSAYRTTPSLTKSLASSTKTLPSVSFQPSPSLTKSLAPSAKTLPSVSSQPSPSLTKSLASSVKTLPSVSIPPPPPVSSLSSFSFGTPPSSPKPCRPSTKPVLSLAPSNPTNPNSKTAYILVEKDASPIYAIPEDFKDLIKNDIVPRILKRPLSPSTYKDYFEALLYAEDFYLEKWDGFEMKNVTLELEEASIYKRKGKHNKKNVDDEKDDKVFVTFELDSIPERRPFLLSRDFVSVSPSGTRVEPLQCNSFPISITTNLVSPKKATYHETDKTSTPKSPHGLSSESSPKSHASSSKTLPPESRPPPPPVSSLSNSSPKKATYPETDKTYAQKLLYGLSSESSLKSHATSSKTLPFVSRPPPPPVSSFSSSSFGTPPSSLKPGPPSTKPILSVAPSNPTNPNSKTTYICVGESPTYAIPEDFKDSIKNDVVPGILKRPLSPSTYKDYFEALLYAEDFYLEKWDGFEMKNVTLELEEASIHKRKGKYNNKNVDDEKDDKVFVAFELDSIPERRPFVLSRDFVSVSPSGTRAEPFQGLIYRVVKSTRVLVEFGEDFHVQHYSACEYNVNFSFNRVCLKRAHQAIATASDNLFRNFLFPDSISNNNLLTAQPPSIDSNLDWHQISAVRHILNHQNAVPYLVEGPITVNRSIFSSRTGFVVCEAVLQVYRTSPSCRILICAPTNKGCDVITRRLMEKVPESNIFRANAAFRELDEVPEEILPSCLYIKERECFSCPSIHELQKFKVISSTFMSSHWLHNEGITAGHFSHIFLVDASCVIEPEAMVALANLANESTVVTVTGAPGDHSGWIHSPMARQNGLRISYFERLRKSKLYESLDSKVITVL